MGSFTPPFLRALDDDKRSGSAERGRAGLLCLIRLGAIRDVPRETRSGRAPAAADQPETG